jgi:hypothetical protein
MRAVSHGFAMHSENSRRIPPRLRRVSCSDPTAGAPSGAMLSADAQHPAPSSRRRPECGGRRAERIFAMPMARRARCGCSASSSDLAFRAVWHCFAAYSCAQSRAFTRLRQAGVVVTFSAQAWEGCVRSRGMRCVVTGNVTKGWGERPSTSPQRVRAHRHDGEKGREQLHVSRDAPQVATMGANSRNE